MNSKTTGIVALVGGMALGGVMFFAISEVSSDDDSFSRPDLPANTWCIEEVWEKGLAPADFTKVQLIDDCTQALESGWNRPILRDMYKDIKEEGG